MKLIVLSVMLALSISQAWGDTCGIQQCPPSRDSDKIYCCVKGEYEWANNLVQSKEEGCCDLSSKILNWVQANLQAIIIAAAILFVVMIALTILCICCSWCCCCC